MKRLTFVAAYEEATYVCSVCAWLDLSVSSSSWGLGRAAVCDCGPPWTFLLPFFFFFFFNKTESPIFDHLVLYLQECRPDCFDALLKKNPQY